jgi:hypothetical protein
VSATTAGLRSVAVLAGSYLVADAAFAYVTRTEGLLTPGGSPNLDVLALGAVYLGVRIVARLVGPGAIAWGLVSSLRRFPRLRLRPPGSPRAA